MTIALPEIIQKFILTFEFYGQDNLEKVFTFDFCNGVSLKNHNYCKISIKCTEKF